MISRQGVPRALFLCLALVVVRFRGGNDPATKLGALLWGTNGGSSKDDGKGSALRNWELADGVNTGEVDVFIT